PDRRLHQRPKPAMCRISAARAQRRTTGRVPCSSVLRLPCRTHSLGIRRGNAEAAVRVSSQRKTFSFRRENAFWSFQIDGVGLVERYVDGPNRFSFSTSVVRFRFNSFAACPLLPPVRSRDI